MEKGSTRSNGRITVRTALELPAMRRGVPEVVAGEENLDRPIRWVHAGEVPNIASLLKGGELLLTTGMGLQVDEKEQRRFAGALADRGVATLVIELGTTFTAVPRGLLQEARRRGLPIVALHQEVPFVEISEALQREIVNRHFAELRRSEALHRRFTAQVLAGAGIPEVLASLAEEISNPVALHKDGQDGMLYHVAHVADSSDVIAAWETSLVDASAAPRIECARVPTAGTERWGSVAAIELDSPLDELDRLAMERAAEAVALILLRHRQEDVLAVRERGNFLADLLSGRLGESDAYARAEKLGVPRDTHLLLPLAVVSSPRLSSPTNVDETIWAAIWRDTHRELGGLNIASMGGVRSPSADLLAVVGLSSDEQRSFVVGQVVRFFQAAATRHLNASDGVVICIGAPARSWTALATELSRTAEAAPGAAQGPVRPWHDVTQPDVHRLFWTLRDQRPLGEFVQSCLAPIIEHDTQRASKQLLPTLEAYCAHGGRKAETARALHVERQSLYHRLERIEALLGRDLSDDDTIFMLSLALRARGYVDEAT